MHRTIGLQRRAQSAQSGIRIRQMMKNARADDLVEVHPQFAYALDRELMDVEVCQVILLL
jgi:hypothetical protein